MVAEQHMPWPPEAPAWSSQHCSSPFRLVPPSPWPWPHPPRFGPHPPPSCTAASSPSSRAPISAASVFSNSLLASINFLQALHHILVYVRTIPGRSPRFPVGLPLPVWLPLAKGRRPSSRPRAAFLLHRREAVLLTSHTEAALRLVKHVLALASLGGDSTQNATQVFTALQFWKYPGGVNRCIRLATEHRGLDHDSKRHAYSRCATYPSIRSARAHQGETMTPCPTNRTACHCADLLGQRTGLLVPTVPRALDMTRLILLCNRHIDKPEHYNDCARSIAQHRTNLKDGLSRLPPFAPEPYGHA